MCMWGLGLCVHMNASIYRSEVSDPSGAGAAGSCKPPAVGAGNSTQVPR